MSSGVQFPHVWSHEFYDAHQFISAHVSTYRNQIWIAGGAVRDFILHRPMKDFDIFVLARDPEAEAAHLSAIADEIDNFGDVRTSSAPREMRRFAFNLNNGVVPRNGAISHPLNVVLPEVMHISTVLDQFDIGVCKIAWQPGAIYVHPDFVQDAADRVIRQRTYGLWTKENSNAHVRRLMDKYGPSGWSVEWLENAALRAGLMGDAQTVTDELRSRLGAQTKPIRFEGADFELLDDEPASGTLSLAEVQASKARYEGGCSGSCVAGRCNCHNAGCYGKERFYGP